MRHAGRLVASQCRRLQALRAHRLAIQRCRSDEVAATLRKQALMHLKRLGQPGVLCISCLKICRDGCERVGGGRALAMHVCQQLPRVLQQQRQALPRLLCDAAAWLVRQKRL